MPKNAMPPEGEGANVHLRALEALYDSAPINRLFESTIELAEPGRSRIRFDVREEAFHAAGAAHGTLYFKMLDDAAFYAANSLVSDRFLLTTAFNLHFTAPMREGPMFAEGRWVSGKRRVFVADARIVDRSRILADLPPSSIAAMPTVETLPSSFGATVVLAPRWNGDRPTISATSGRREACPNPTGRSLRAIGCGSIPIHG
jgi:uncharacterized protein (TIGR00369 family)